MASTAEENRVRVWRITKQRHVESAFDGEGAFRFGGRWNRPGTRLVYTSGSFALAALELLVHLDPNHPIPHLMAIPIDIPSELIEPGPSAMPESLESSRRIGDAWAAGGTSPALSVPSALIPQEQNVLLNPSHSAFHHLILNPPIPFNLDPRLRP